MPSWLSTWSMTRCRSALERADHPGPHVAGARDGERLEHLRNLGQVRGDGLVPGALPDLQGEERGDGEAELLGVEVGAPARHHSRGGELVEPGLDRAAGDAEPAGGLEHPDARFGGEQVDHLDVQRVHVGLRD